MSHRSAWRLFGAAATVLVLLVACAAVWTWFGPTYTADKNLDHHGTPARVTVRTGDGNVTVRSGPDGDVTVASHASWSTLTRPTAGSSTAGTTLNIVGTCPALGRCTVDFVVTVPAGVAVDITTDGGDVHATGLTGDTTLTSAAGDVTADSLGGTVRLNSDAGSVHGTGLRCTTMAARLHSGDLTLAFATVPTAITASDDAGDLTLALAPGVYRVTTEGGTPDVSVDTSPTATSTVDARTSAGSLHVQYAHR